MARASPQTDRIVAVINLLIAHTGDGLTLSEMARRLRLNKATCYPMLMALTEAGFLTRHPTRKTFDLGSALISAGHAAAVRNRGLEFARTTMTDLANELDLTCLILAPAIDHMRVIDQAWHSRRDIPYLHIGQKIPLRLPAAAAFVAWSDAAVFSRWLRGDRIAESEVDYFRSQLAAIRRNGYAITLQLSADQSWRRMATELKRTITREDRSRILELLQSEMARQKEPFLARIDDRKSYDAGNIEAPIFGSDGHVSMTISVTNLPAMSGKQIRKLAVRIRDAAEQISVAAGAPSPSQLVSAALP